jgi:hypothetical protein
LQGFVVNNVTGSEKKSREIKPFSGIGVLYLKNKIFHRFRLGGSGQFNNCPLLFCAGWLQMAAGCKATYPYSEAPFLSSSIFLLFYVRLIEDTPRHA